MTESEYLKERLEVQITWYDSKSVSAQRWSVRLRAIEIGIALTIPLLVSFAATYRYAIYGTALAGVLVALIAALRSVYQLDENWVRYRLVAESLKREKYLFLARAGAYSSSADPLRDLAQRVEGLVSGEHSKWGATVLADTHGEGAGSKD